MTKDAFKIDYYNSLVQALEFIVSGKDPRQKLDFIVKLTATTVDAGASLIMLDSTGNNLVHTSSWKLPRYYLQKGLIDRFKSLNELSTGKTVIIDDTQSDSRIQYPELALQARIHAIYGIPIIIGNTRPASLRVYLRSKRSFASHELNFINHMAALAALVIKEQQPALTEEKTEQVHTLPQPLKPFRDPSCFANESEVEFARLLDFYNIEWVYEPRSFVLNKEGNRITEMFSPDFYLPELDLYVELTTLKQSLITQKNRKIRRLKELYPDINITLMNKNKYDTLLAKYGAGPLGQTRAQGITRILFNREEISEKVLEIASRISSDYKEKHPVLIGVQRGFICFMADLIRNIDGPLDIDFMAISHYMSGNNELVKFTRDVDLSLTNRHVLLVEDIVDTGMTLKLILNQLQLKNPASLEVCTLLDRKTRRIANIDIRYSGFEITDEFVVGYGLDFKEEYRNLPFIGIPDLSDKKYSAQDQGKTE